MAAYFFREQTAKRYPPGGLPAGRKICYTGDKRQKKGEALGNRTTGEKLLDETLPRFWGGAEK